MLTVVSSRSLTLRHLRRPVILSLTTSVLLVCMFVRSSLPVVQVCGPMVTSPSSWLNPLPIICLRARSTVRLMRTLTCLGTFSSGIRPIILMMFKVFCTVATGGRIQPPSSTQLIATWMTLMPIGMIIRLRPMTPRRPLVVV